MSNLIKKQVITSAALLLIASFPWQANASTFSFSFAGPGVSGSVDITYGAATDSKSHGFEISGVSGSFSDSNNGLNIVNAPIASLVPINYAAPDATNLLAPTDFSKFYVTSGLGPMAHGALTYDNLYYPNGAPATATDYQAAGGIFDIYGLMFNIGNSEVVDLWSNGTFDPTAPFTYGVAVATSANALDYVSDGVNITPEPGTLGLLGCSLFGMLIWRRRSAS